MRRKRRGAARLFVAAALAAAAAAGCSVNTQFVYKPNPPDAPAVKVPVKVAVLPFSDGTEDFIQHGSVFGRGGYINFAKVGYSGLMTALPPPRWSKFLAEEMVASGAFQSVRLVFERADVGEDEVALSGTVLRAYFAFEADMPSRLAVRMEARAGRAGKILWQKEIARDVPFGEPWGEGCGISPQCSIDKYHGHHNRLLREIFLEARREIAAAVAGGSSAPPSGAPPAARAPKSADEILRGIMGDK